VRKACTFLVLFWIHKEKIIIEIKEKEIQSILFSDLYFPVEIIV